MNDFQDNSVAIEQKETSNEWQIEEQKDLDSVEIKNSSGEESTTQSSRKSIEELIEMRDNALDSDVEIPKTPDELQIDPNMKIDDSENPRRVRRFQTIMNIVNAVLGAGMLGIPYSMRECGVIVSCILLIVVACMSYFGSILVIKLQYRTKAGTFEELATIILGKPGKIAFSFSSIMFCYSGMVAYLVIARDNVLSWFSAGGIEFTSKISRAIVLLINSLLIPIPLTIPKSLGFLSYFSMATVFSVMYFLVAMVVKSIMILPHGFGKGIVLFKGGMSIFSAISVYALTFCLPVIIISLISPYNKDVGKRGVVTMWSLGLCTIIILVPSVLGYLCYGEDCQDNILNTFPSNDYYILTVKVAFYLVVSFSYPIIGQNVMSTWGQVIFNSNDQASLSLCRRTAVIILTNSIALFVAMVLPNITPALSVGGSVGGSLAAFFFPSLMWVTLSKKPWTAPKNIFMSIYTVIGFTISCVCIYQAVIDAIDAFK